MPNPTTTEKAENYIVVEKEWISPFRNIPEECDGFRLVRAYENNDGEKGDLVYEQLWKNGEIVEMIKWETMKWEDFCAKYRSDKKYA